MFFRILATCLILGLSAGSVAVAEEKASKPGSSKWSSQIDQCIKANKSGRAKTIQEFVCPGGTLTPQQIAYQVILDLEFKKIDKAVEAELLALQQSEWKDVGAINAQISEMFDTTIAKPKYPTQYTNVCNKTVVAEGMKHFGKLSTDSDTQFFVSGQTRCQALVKKKLEAYRDAAWLFGQSAIVRSYEEDKHDFFKDLKAEYEKFLNKWAIYLGQLGVIKDKWSSKTKTGNGTTN